MNTGTASKSSGEDDSLNLTHALSPVEKAKAICEAEGDSFRDVLELHLLDGVVISTPTHFLMGRDVGGAWFVWVGVGDAATLLAMMPYELPLIGWHRIGRGWDYDHWTKTANLKRRLTRVTSAHTSGP